MLRAAGGRLVDSASIPEVAYEASLVDLPAHGLRHLLDRQDVIALCDAVMVVRPQSSVTFPIAADQTEVGTRLAPASKIEGGPIAALFDGVPVQGHALLDGRLLIDDPEDLGARSVVATRDHGTAMASVILHGDRNLEEVPLTRRVYVRPVLVPTDDGLREEFPRDRLLIDTIYSAVRRMKEGDVEGEATAPTVFLVNLSLGDERRPFSGPISPWARLLDHLAARHGILFLVSAGNVGDPLPAPAVETLFEFADATPVLQRQIALSALGRESSRRTLLSPAEALNVLTVGAWHKDTVATEHPDYVFSPLGGRHGTEHHFGLGAGIPKGHQAGHHDAWWSRVGESDDVGEGTCPRGREGGCILRDTGGGA